MVRHERWQAVTLFNFLAANCPFDERELEAIIATAPRRYKSYEIAKRSGRGTRTIAQPAPEVKLLQRLLIDNFIGKWPVHAAATAYRQGSSIASHAERHLHSRFLLKLDFSDFFPSIKASDVRAYTRHVQGTFTAKDIEALVNLVCWRGKNASEYCLSIGAPSSPSLSNSILFDFDSRMVAHCSAKRVEYSRYADDMAFSSTEPNVLEDVKEYVKVVLKELPYPRLHLNESKTVNVSKKYRRSLVGLVLTPANVLSLGRERKRSIRATVHRFLRGQLSGEEVARLKGLMAFAWSIEPGFFASLERTYGPGVIAELGFPPGQH